MELRFVIPGRPKTWQRPTDDRRSGRRNVTDADQRAAKKMIGYAALAARPRGWPLDALYSIEVVGYWPDRRTGDADRLTSLAMDALEGVAYGKDRQVREQSGSVRVDHERPRTEVLVRVIGEDVRGDGVSRESASGSADVVSCMGEP